MLAMAAATTGVSFSTSAVHAPGRAVSPGAYRREPRCHLARSAQALGMEPGRSGDLHAAPLARRRRPWDGQDAPRTCQSHPHGARKHENPGAADRHRHEPQEAGGGCNAVALFNHRKPASPTAPDIRLKRLLQQPPLDRFLYARTVVAHERLRADLAIRLIAGLERCGGQWPQRSQIAL